MGRKMPGIYQTDAGFEVDKWYNGTRIRRRGFANFEEAEEWLICERTRISRANSTTPRRAWTFEEAATHYLQKYQDKPSIESDVYHLKPVMPFVGNLRLDQVHNLTLEPFIKARKAEGRKNKTINLSLSAVRRILNLAARDWRDENGRTWLATAPLITMLTLTDQRKPAPLMWPEQRRLLAKLPRHLADMAVFMLNCGVRDEVVCNLQWNWEVPVPQLGISVFVVPAMHVKGELGRKTDRVLVCNSVAQAIIERQRDKHPTHVFVYRRERVKNLGREPVMPYRPIETMNNSAWQRARWKAELGDLHVHDLRHTVGLRLREAGVSESTRSEILWHSTKTMTGHYSMAQIVEVYEALEKIKDEANRFNVSLESLIRDAAAARVPQKSPAQKKTG